MVPPSTPGDVRTPDLPIRLLVLTAAYPADSEPERGVFIETLTRALLDEPGGTVTAATVVAPRVRATDAAAETRRGIAVRRFAYPGGGRRLKEISRPRIWLQAVYLLSAIVAALRAARGRHVDVICAHWVLPMGPVAAIVSLALRRPFIVFAHGSDIRQFARRGLLRRVASWVLRRARRVAAVSRDLADRIECDHALGSDRITLLPMGVDGAVFGSGELAGGVSARRGDARARLEIEDDRDVLLFVGDVDSAKGVVELVEAWRTVSAARPSTTLCVAGDGARRAWCLEALADDVSAQRCRLPGRIPQRDLVDWYDAADVFVLPSHSEGTPVSILEAQSRGLPVVATRVGGIVDLVDDGVTGRLVPPHDAPALASALLDVFRTGELERLRDAVARADRAPTAAERGARLGRLIAEVSSDV